MTMRTRNMRPGQIMLWYGSIATVPSGWHLCSGLMGTPDLRNVFVSGVTESAHVGDSNGTLSHAHGYTGPLHTHTFIADTEVLAGTDFNDTTEQSRICGMSDPNSHLPNYRSLCYIMKIN